MSSEQVDYDSIPRKTSKRDLKQERREARYEEKKEKRERKHERKIDKIEKKIEKIHNDRDKRLQKSRDVRVDDSPVSSERYENPQHYDSGNHYYLRRNVKESHLREEFDSLDPSKIPDVTFSVNPDEIPDDISLSVDPSEIPDE